MRIISTCMLVMFMVAWGGCADYLGPSGDAGYEEDGDGGPSDAGDRLGDDGEALDAGGDMGGDQLPADCDRYISALADCPYQLVMEIQPQACPRAVCMNKPCAHDEDCLLAGASENGDKCVLGNCVYCWQDSECNDGFACRGGRCVDVEANPCGNNPTCQSPGCSMISISERPCPVCVCDSVFGIACEEDLDCLPLSSHLYRHCVYGRCADCKDDSECDYGACMPPGFCNDMQPHSSAIYGAWLIGWYGGMDHFSYFRFEPDGTLRRGMYLDAGAWSDDIPPLPCWPQEPWPMALVGSWETLLSGSGQFFLRASLNLPCDDGAGWIEFIRVELSADGQSASFEFDGGQTYDGWRVPIDSCSADFRNCDSPNYP